MKLCKESPIYVIDFEGNTQTGIIEYGIVGLQDGKIFEAHTSICRSFAKIPEIEFMLHKISFDETIDKKPFSSHIDIFVERRKRGPFCAHNAIFEEKLISSAFPVVPNIPKFFDNLSSIGWGPWVDTYSIYRRCFHKLKKFTLESLVSAFNLSEQLDSIAKELCPPTRCNYHCALFDAIASALLLITFIAKMKATMSIQELLIYSSVSKKQFEILNQSSLQI